MKERGSQPGPWVCAGAGNDEVSAPDRGPRATREEAPSGLPGLAGHGRSRLSRADWSRVNVDDPHRRRRRQSCSSLYERRDPRPRYDRNDGQEL